MPPLHPLLCLLAGAAILLPLPAKASGISEPKPPAYPLSSSRILNIAELGAIGDGTSHPLREKFPTQDAIDAHYGKGLYTLDDEQDYVAFSESLRFARTLSRSNNASELDIGLPEIYLPNGVYLFNRTVELVNLWGLNIRGAGRASTTINFSKKGSSLFKIYMSGELAFKDLGFASNFESMATIISLDNIHTEEGAGRPTFKIRFEEVNWSGAYRCIYAGGEEMCDTILLDRCRMVYCLIGIHINNYNSVNWVLNACDFEAVPSSPDMFLPFKPSDCTFLLVEEGGAVTVLGGSIIHGGRTLVLKSPATEQKHAGNVFFNFYGVKFEDHGVEPYLFDFVNRAFSPVSINFYGCSAFHSMAVVHSGQPKPANGRLGNGMNVTLDNCLFTHGSFEGVIDEQTRDNWGSLVVNNSRTFRYHETRPGDAATLKDVHHHVSYRPGGGHRPEDIALYHKLYAIQQMPADRYPDLKPENYMAFDIVPNESTPVSLKRIVKTIPITSDAREGTLRFPKGATLSLIRVAGAPGSTATIRLLDANGTPRQAPTRLAAGNATSSLERLELINDGNQWDGIVHFDAATPAGDSSMRIICEYY